MSNEIVVALIALAGVVFSIIVSLFTSLWQTNKELAKIRQEMQIRYADRLITERLQQYPEMYFLLSAISKQIELGNVSKSDIIQLLKKLNDCDSRISLLFSGRANVISFKLRKSLTELTQLSDDEFNKVMKIGDRFTQGNILQKLDFETGEMELALKNDLGVFAVEYSDLTKRFSSYQELTKNVEQQK